MKTVVALARACHPEPTAGVTAITTALAVSAGRGWGAAWVAAAVFCGQLSVGWANDYLDRDLDLAAGRTDKPIPSGRVTPGTVRNAALVALPVAILLSLTSGFGATLAHGLALAMAHAYNLKLKATPFSVVAYAVAFSQVPVFVALGLPASHFPAAWTMVAAGLIGAGGHFTQVLPDLAADARTGVRGLPQRLGYRGSVAAAAVLLAAGSLTAAFGPGRSLLLGPMAALIAALVLVGAVVLAAVGGRAKLSFRLTIAAAGAALLIFVLNGGLRL